jgi:hypothetical protein
MTSRRSLCCLLAALFLLAATAVEARPSNKWRLECSGNAESAGTITLLMAPRGEPELAFEIPIQRRTSENAVARAIRDALKADPRASARWRMEVDDGEDVLIKKRRGQPDFDLRIGGNTVKGVRLNPDRE